MTIQDLPRQKELKTVMTLQPQKQTGVYSIRPAGSHPSRALRGRVRPAGFRRIRPSDLLREVKPLGGLVD
jgi:hypothetical protein